MDYTMLITLISNLAEALPSENDGVALLALEHGKDLELVLTLVHLKNVYIRVHDIANSN